jgi:hypothetical protein
MLIAALICLVSYGRNIPLAEDWLMVPPLTASGGWLWELSNEPGLNLGGWLWEQNNEHRNPLTRLILLTALKFTKGDFRSGMILNVLTLALIAVVAMLVARHLRSGKTSYTDAFFPIALLNIGNWPNLFWGWQFTQVLPTAFTYILLFIFVIQPTLATPLAAAIAGVILVLLPLCGASGLFFVPFIASWFIYRGLVNWCVKDSKDKQRWAGIISISSAVIALVLIGIYFIGYKRSNFYVPSPGLETTLKTAAKFLAYSFGAVAGYSWDVFVLIAFGILIPTFGLVILAVLRHQGFERQRALAILLFCSVLGIFALSMGYARAGVIPSQGFPIRYVIFAVPLLCTAFFIWEIYGPRKWQKIVHWGLFLGMSLLLPFNTLAGFQAFGNWYDNGMNSVLRDINAGMSICEISKRNREFLIHWSTDDELKKHIKMLYEDRVSLFAAIQQKPGNNCM